MTLVAGLAIIMAVAGVIFGPFQIGAPRKPLTANGYLAYLFQAIIFILLSGRVMGWW